jgi:DNA replication protein DnaC
MEFFHFMQGFLSSGTLDFHCTKNNDSVIAAAILDRLIHHSTIINITGKSYRTKDKLVVPSKQQMQS